MKNVLYSCLLGFCLISCSSEIGFYQSPKEKKDQPTASFRDTTTETPKAVLLYNELSIDSEETTNYYREQRGIDQKYLCPVKTHTSLAGSPDDLLSIRRQIINTCLCPNFSNGTSCNENNLTALLINPQVPTHLVIFKGIPTQLKNHPWNIPSSTVFDKHHNVSFDYYLAHAILNSKADCSQSDCLFGNGSTGITGIPWLNAYTPIYRQSNFLNNASYTHYQNSYSGKVEALNLSTHKTFAYGRIEGLTVESTKKMIDRTLLAERNGPRGNFFGTGNPAARTSIEEVFHFPQSWTTGTGVPPTQNAIFFDGEDIMSYVPYYNVQHGFINEFNRLLSWRVGENSCIPLCKDTSNVENCKVESLDPYKVLNSSCVGVNPGFIGRQVRSFPVQFMGVYPQGWQTAVSGAQTVTPPVFDPGGYIVFGDSNYRRRNDCSDKNGIAKDCDPKTEIYMKRNFQLFPAMNIGTSLQNLKLSFDYKGYSTNPARVEVVFDFQTANGTVFKSTYSVDLNGEINQFIKIEDTIAFSSSNPMDVQLLTLTIQSPTSDGSPSEYSFNRIPVLGHFAIDNIEANLPTENRNLIPMDASRFDEPYMNNLVEGDWAGQVHRLGASAWWGSMSHFYTGGYAWFDMKNTTEALLSGRTLGEALLYTGNGMSGIFYGDPLYQPLSASLYMNSSLFEIGAPLSNRSIFGDDEEQVIYITPESSNSVKTAPLYFDAHFGTNANYHLDLCVGHYFAADCSTWETIGGGTARNGIVNGTESGLMGLHRQNGYHIVRLKVEPADTSGLAIQRFARFYLQDGNVTPSAFLESIQFIGGGWPIYFFDHPEIGSFLDGISRNWRANINILQVKCNNSSSLCDPNLLTLEMLSLTGQTLPVFTKSVFISSQSGEITVYFFFDGYLPKCDTVRIKLRSGNYEVTFPQIHLVTGDFNFDGKVDSADFTIFRQGFNKTGGYNLLGDIDIDFKVDSLDFVRFRNNFNCNSLP